MSKKLIALSIVLMLALPVATTAYAIAETELPSDLKLRSVELHKNIMCPKCSGQTLHQSNSPIASSMREVIREELLKGKSNDQIINLMVNAGIDIFCFGNNLVYDPDIVKKVYAIIDELLKEGLITAQQIETSYNRILRLKELVGLS